ncbi:hypothetical protein ACSNOK_01595 [Streptomyces sp. URMC 126]|uniref:hypothetical protein n=1 Tax=Streptomyces sp. URMC 126 TaxID=3423401 RepID=UPI003F1BFCD1
MGPQDVDSSAGEGYQGLPERTSPAGFPRVAGIRRPRDAPERRGAMRPAWAA